METAHLSSTYYCWSLQLQYSVNRQPITSLLVAKVVSEARDAEKPKFFILSIILLSMRMDIFTLVSPEFCTLMEHSTKRRLFAVRLRCFTTFGTKLTHARWSVYNAPNASSKARKSGSFLAQRCHKCGFTCWSTVQGLSIHSPASKTWLYGVLDIIRGSEFWLEAPAVSN